MGSFRPTWVEVSREAFRHNLKTVKQFVGPSVQVLSVLKADGYGHGAVVLSKIAREEKIPFIGVSSIEEALSLRESGDKGSMLIMGSIYPLENFSAVVDYNLTPTIFSREAALFLKEVAYSRKKTLSFHLKIDTGMGRLGLSPDAAKGVLKWIKSEPLIRLEGVYSHFADADSNNGFTKDQLKIFLDIKDYAVSLGFKNILFHMANSAATLTLPESHFDMIRPGLMLYGAPFVGGGAASDYLPVLSWKSRAIYLKKVPPGTTISYGRTYKTVAESDIITVPVGYADGVPRSVSNKGRVLVKGKRCPIVGRVTMDHIMVDVTGLSVQVGDEVTLIGTQGDASISVHEWAAWAGTIPYEIFCGISKRVPRVTL